MKNYIRLLVLSLLLGVFTGVLFTGCQTTNGIARDVRSGANWVVEATQETCDTMQENSIAQAMREQNSIIRRGQKMEVAIGR